MRPFVGTAALVRLALRLDRASTGGLTAWRVGGSGADAAG